MDRHKEIQVSSSPSLHNICIILFNSFLLSILCWKRHFQYLYATLKTDYPHHTDLNALHFPRKSMFHTFSDQTKAKRRNNFDEFIKIALQIFPMPLCVEDFLDIIDRCGRSYSHSVLSDDNKDSSSSNIYNKPLPYTYTPPSKKERLYNRKSHSSGASCAADHESSDSSNENNQNNPAAMNDILNQKDDTKKMTNVLYSTFMITTILYIGFIYMGIIDIEGCNFGMSEAMLQQTSCFFSHNHV